MGGGGGGAGASLLGVGSGILGGRGGVLEGGNSKTPEFPRPLGCCPKDGGIADGGCCWGTGGNCCELGAELGVEFGAEEGAEGVPSSAAAIALS